MIKLQAGKRYKTREGRVVEIMFNPSEECLFYSTGFYLYRSDGFCISINRDLDIVSEEPS